MSASDQLSLFDTDAGSAFPLSSDVEKTLNELARVDETESRGAVFTRVEVVEFMLDVVGYVADAPLHQKTILEPACGGGDFVLPMIDRLFASWQSSQPEKDNIVGDLGEALLAVELHLATFTATRQKVIGYLTDKGIDPASAEALTSRWLRQGDFLLEPFTQHFDFVVGNPPYVRQEYIPAPLLAAYKRHYATLYDRADLYIPFIERALTLLSQNGTLGFICPDRWMKNRYGGPLRALVARDYHLRIHIDMVGTNAFLDEVSAYPAITVFERSQSVPPSQSHLTRIVRKPKIDRESLSILARKLHSKHVAKNSEVQETTIQTNGMSPWILESSDRIALLRRIEREYPTLEEAGCKVGIGVATGADKAFIGRYDDLDVEADRKLPLVMTKDIQSGEVQWRGNGIINPFADDGKLVDLDGYPKLRDYLEQRKDRIAGRHCAQKNPANWYRTIDRIWPSLAKRPKLLIPDIKGEAHIVYESGHFYPHHNLYYVVSDEWDLRALQAVLLSSITNLFIATYSTHMRGGYLRFQAQYLRRLRLPKWTDVNRKLRTRLVEAGRARAIATCNQAAFELYEISGSERHVIGMDGA